jgi:hypothetical protein
VTNEDGATTGDTWSIERAAVTINTLTINGKQVTLDVFRQLKEAVLINHDGSLAGSPWGLVNYHEKGCDKLEKHRHVVWQLDDQLRQDTIQPQRWDQPYWSDTCDALVFAYGTIERLPTKTMRSGVVTEDPVRPRQSRPSWPRLAARAILMLFQPPPGPLQPPPGEPLQPRPEEPGQPDRFRWHPPQLDHEWPNHYFFSFDGIECRGHSRHPNDVWDAGPELAAEHAAVDRAALLAQLKVEVAAEKERRGKHEARWAEILDLPQLFIAG